MITPPNTFPDESRLPALHVEPSQASRRQATVYENELGDALEAAFGAGLWELDGLVARLNAYGVRTPEGQAWTVESFQAVMQRLGA